MSIAQRGSTTTATADSSVDDVTANKPTGTVSGDVLIAAVVTNNVNVTPPSGWTEFLDEVEDVFRLQCFYKVAGGSEPTTYTFTGTAFAAKLLAITAWSGVDTTDVFDIDDVPETSLTHSEPYTTPSLSGTGATSGRLMYIRACRDDTTSLITYTASSVTELADFGRAQTSTSYSMGLYCATSDYTGTGTKSGLAITASSTETHNVVATWALKALAVPGTMEAGLPPPTMTADGNWSYPAVVDVDLSLPTVDVSAWAGNTEGTLEAPVPVTMSLAGSINPTGTLDVIVLPTMELLGETRFFAENVVDIAREERWLIMTQDGYRLGVRAIRYTALAVALPLPEVTITALQSEAEFGDAGTASVTATANAATAPRRPSAGTVTASATANSATARIAPSAGTVSATVTVNQPTTTKASFASAGHASVSVTANNVPFAGSESADAGTATATATANQPTILIGRLASAGHVSVTCHN